MTTLTKYTKDIVGGIFMHTVNNAIIYFRRDMLTQLTLLQETKCEICTVL